MKPSFSIWKNSMMVWILSAVVSIFAAIIGNVYGVSEPVGKVVLTVACSSMFCIAIIALTAEMSRMIWIRDSIIASIRVGDGYWHFRIDRTTPYPVSFVGAETCALDFAEGAHTTARNILVRIQSAVGVTHEQRFNMSALEGHLFTTVLPRGHVGANGPLGWKPSRGVAKRRWMEVEYTSGRCKDTHSLMRHELAHALLMTVVPGMPVHEQHRIIREAKIDRY